MKRAFSAVVVFGNWSYYLCLPREQHFLVENREGTYSPERMIKKILGEVMEILAVLENEYCQNVGALDSVPNKTEWNGRTVTILEEGECKIFRKTTDAQKRIVPLMGKPDRGEASIRGGVDEERGVYVEGSVSISWGGSESSSDSKKQGSENEKHSEK